MSAQEKYELSKKQEKIVDKFLNIHSRSSKKYIALPAAPGSGKTTTLISGIEAFFSVIALKQDKQMSINGEVSYFMKGYTSENIREEFDISDLHNVNQANKILILAFNKNATDDFIKRADKINIKTIEKVQNEDGSIEYMEKLTKLSLLIEVSTYHSLLLKVAKPLIDQLGYIPDYSKANFYKKDIAFISDKNALKLKNDEIKFYHKFIEDLHNSPLDFPAFCKSWNSNPKNQAITIEIAKKIQFVVNKMYDEMARKNITMPHCFYYKLVHKHAQSNPEFLKRIFQDKQGKEASLILVDEAQDADAIIYDLIKKSNKKAIFVGDTFQNIYGFRGTYNVFDDLSTNELHNTEFFDLNESFRYGKAISSLTSSIPEIFGHKNSGESHTIGIQEKDYIHDKPLNIDNIIKFSRNTVVNNINIKKTKKETANQIAIICRSNKKALEIYSCLKEDTVLAPFVKIESGLKSKTKDFISKGINAIEDEALKEQILSILGEDDFTFDDMLRNEQICNLLVDTEYAYLLKCKDEKLKNAMLQKSSGYETITIITVHGSKGLEYENVIIADDYININSNPVLDALGLSEDTLSNDEINIIYTATTRAKESLFFMEGELYNSLSTKINEYSIYNSNELTNKNNHLLESNIEIIKEKTKEEKKAEQEEDKKNIFEINNLFSMN